MSPPLSFSSDQSATTVLDQVLHHAMQAGASDVHLESDPSLFRVRFRIDGLLRTVATPPLSIRDAMLSRLKVLSRMDIAEKRLPQDGRIDYTHAGQRIDLRVSSLPTWHSEKLVLRVLKFDQTAPNLEELGLEAMELQRLTQALHASDGMILMTGPTGSGKTRSIYSCLNRLDREALNISTLEDPIEIQLKGINQVQIHERSGLSFAHAMRALLRQDPDVIMLGEIRDVETADIALQAAQTGHLVLSTLHTPNAPSALFRLQQMGAALHHIADSIRLVVAQRLLRRLCPHCRQPLSSSPASPLLPLAASDRINLADLQPENSVLYTAVGCDQCEDGYRGRVGVFQVVPVSDAIQQLLFQRVAPAVLAKQAQQESVRTLRACAWLKAWQGETTVQEVLQHTPAD